MAEPAEVRAVRVARATWNAACEAVGGDPDQLTLKDWAALEDAGIATAGREFDANWRGLITSYLDAPIALRVASTYAGMTYEAAVAVAPASLCVLERHRTVPGTDGGPATLERDDLLEVSMTAGHPWQLVERVLPPLEILRAPAQQTSHLSAKPITIDPATQARLTALLAQDPGADIVEQVKRNATGPVTEFLAPKDGQVAFLVTSRGAEVNVLSGAWYVASEEHLFRCFIGDSPWEEVAAGDLAFSVTYQLMGAADRFIAAAAAGAGGGKP